VILSPRLKRRAFVRAALKFIAIVIGLAPYAVAHADDDISFDAVTGYRIAHYRAAVPETVPGGTRVDRDRVDQLIKDGAVLLDVMPSEGAGVFLEAAGGGCSSPAMARGDSDWTTTVGNAQGKLWRNADGTARLRLRVRHPMDTGLAKDNTPAFFIEKLDVKGAGGEPLATIELFEPVSEDPTLTLSVKPQATDASVSVDGRDNNGNIYRSVVPASWNQSALAAPRAATR